VERHGGRHRAAGADPAASRPLRGLSGRPSSPLSVVWDNLDLLWEGWKTTLYLTALSFIGALVIGLVLAGCRVSPVPPLRGAAFTYVEIVRNTPLTVHLVLLFFGLPKLGITWSPRVTAVVGLTIYTGSFAGEVIRAGINTVGWGQVEAARAVGLGFGQTMRLVVMPQALRASIGPLGSVLSALVRNTAVAYTISVLDIMGQADRLVTATAQAVPVLFGAALFYYSLTLPLAAGINALERRQRIVR
jgi:glutamate transport system permease protein